MTACPQRGLHRETYRSAGRRIVRTEREVPVDSPTGHPAVTAKKKTPESNYGRRLVLSINCITRIMARDCALHTSGPRPVVGEVGRIQSSRRRGSRALPGN